MPFLARRDDNGDTANLLRLPSRTSMPRDVRNAVNREIAVEAGRVQVQTVRMQGVEWGGHVALRCVRNISRAAEAAAVECPPERARTDAVADSVAVAMVRLVDELGQG